MSHCEMCTGYCYWFWFSLFRFWQKFNGERYQEGGGESLLSTGLD